MKRKYKMILILIIYILLPMKIKAQECPVPEFNKLKAFAITSEVRYNYVKNNNSFEVTFNNVSNQFYIIEDTKNVKLSYDQNREYPNVTTAFNYDGGYQYVFKFYAQTQDSCNGVFLREIPIRLPRYNHYADNSLCQGIESFKLCDKWYQGIITDSSFNKDVLAYKKQSEKKANTAGTNKQTIWNKIIDFAINNYMIILIPIIVLGTFVILLIKLREKRRDIL